MLSIFVSETLTSFLKVTKAVQELIESGRKKLETASKHQEEQNKIHTDIGKKRKVAFEKLFKTTGPNLYLLCLAIRHTSLLL